MQPALTASRRLNPGSTGLRPYPNPRTICPPRPGVDGAPWWREYGQRDEAGLQILRTALEALDRALSSTAAIAVEGMTFKDRFGQPRPHPLLAAERDARAQYLAGLRMLNLDLEPRRERPGRPGGG